MKFHQTKTKFVRQREQQKNKPKQTATQHLCTTMKNALCIFITNNLVDLLVDHVLPCLTVREILQFLLLNKQWNSDLALTNQYDKLWCDLAVVRDKFIIVCNEHGEEEQKKTSLSLLSLQSHQQQLSLSLFNKYNVTNWFQCYKARA